MGKCALYAGASSTSFDIDAEQVKPSTSEVESVQHDPNTSVSALFRRSMLQRAGSVLKLYRDPNLDVRIGLHQE